MAYNAEINVSVKNLNQVTDLEAKLSSISRNVNALNRGAGGGGGRRGGGGGGSSEADPLKEELALLKLQNTALGQSNRAIRVKNKLKGENFKLEDALSKLEDIGRGKDTRDIDLLRKEVEERKKIVIEAEKTLATTVKTVEATSRLKPVTAKPSVVSGLSSPVSGTVGQKGSPAFFAKQMEGAISSFDPKKALPDTRLLRAGERGIERLGKDIAELGKTATKTSKLLRGAPTGFSAEEFGPQFDRSTLPTESALNFDKRTGKLLRGGPGGRGLTGGDRLRNLGRRFDKSSALISGAFPLLFGQGPIGALAGGLGGGIGGMFGTMGGFAGGIAATAAAQEIQKVLDFRKQVSALNMEMRSMGISSNISANSITKLGKSLGVTREEAVKVLEQFKRFGEESIGLAKFFDGDFALFEAFSQADNVSSVLNAIKKSSKDLTMEEELRITRLLTQKGVEAAINELIDVRREKIINLKKEQNKKRSTPKGSLVSGLGVGEAVNQSELSILTTTADKTIENLNKIKDNVTQQKFAVEEAGFSIVSEIEKIDKELRKLNNTQFQTVELSKTISSSFEDSFAGIVKGTMSVQDAFRNMLNSIANHFINTAAKMAANRLQRGLLGLFGNVLGGGLSSVAHGGINFMGVGQSSLQALTPIGSASQFVGSVKGFPTKVPSLLETFADGGRPPVGRASIVGERGPELFVPNRSGTIIPNNKLGGGNNTSVVVNVDASGSDVQGDEEQATQFGSAIATAIQSELIRQQRPGGLLSR